MIDVAKNSGTVRAEGDTPEGEGYGKANQARSRADIGNEVSLFQATQGDAGERLSRTQRGCAVPPGEGRYGRGTSSSVEADTVSCKALRSGPSRIRIARTRRELIGD